MASDVGRLARLDRTALADLARAAFELAIARIRLDSSRTRALIAALPKQPMPIDRRQAAVVDRVAFAIPRVAARLPWRADCLVQALAAQRWLDRNGVATTLTLGAARDAAGFEAHAWLTVGDRIVTGGDISRYSPFSRP